MTADERINALLERAGSPLMFVANPELHTVQSDAIYDTLEDCIEAIVKDRTRGLYDTIDRLEIALHNVLNERDAAIADIPRDCKTCKHKLRPPVLVADTIYYCYNFGCRNISGVYTGWEWRGVPDKEDA